MKNYPKVSCRRHIKSILNGSTADQGEPSETCVSVTRIETISKGVIDFSKIGHVQYEPALERYRLQCGDILLSHINSMSVIGNVAIYEENEPLYVGMNLLRLRPSKSISPKFLFYCFVSQEGRHQVRQLAKPAINQASISTTNLKRIELPLVDFDAQQAIAGFLDSETARIDQLIEDKEHLVSLLREKENAVLDLLFSEVEAAVWRLRHLGTVKGGAGFPVELQGNSDAEIPFFKVKHLKDFGLDARLIETEDYISRATAKALRAIIFPAGTIVFAKIGAALLLNRFSMIGESACIDNNMSAFTPIPSLLDAEFALLSLSRIDMARLVQPGAVPSLSTYAFRNFEIARPDVSTQRDLVAAFRQRRSGISLASETVRNSIDRLHEFRAALITAAVTGQIDVATWGKRGTTDRRLDDIEAEMAPGAQPEPKAMRA